MFVILGFSKFLMYFVLLNYTELYIIKLNHIHRWCMRMCTEWLFIVYRPSRTVMRDELKCSLSENMQITYRLNAALSMA